MPPSHALKPLQNLALDVRSPAVGPTGHLAVDAEIRQAIRSEQSKYPVELSSSMQHVASGLMDHNQSNGLRVGVIDFRNDQRIIPFLHSHPDSLIFHHPAWLSPLQAESGQRCSMLACESDDGSLRGVMPLAYTRGLPFNISNHQTKRRISSLPRTPFAGLLSTNVAAIELLLAAAVQRAKIEDAPLQIKTDKLLPEGIHDNIVCTPWRPTYVLSLPESVVQLKFGRLRCFWTACTATTC